MTSYTTSKTTPPPMRCPTPREDTFFHKDPTCPELDEICTEDDWNIFQRTLPRHWLPALAIASSHRTVDQLWACCSASAKRTT
jgi:hypothetical protein